MAHATQINSNNLVHFTGEYVTTTSVVMSQLFNIKHKHILTHLNLLASKLDGDKDGSLIQPICSAKRRGKAEYYQLNRAGFERACNGFTGPQLNKWRKIILHAFDTFNQNPQLSQTHALMQATYCASLQELKTLARVMNQQGMGFYAGEILRIRDQIAQGYQKQPKHAGGAA